MYGFVKFNDKLKATDSFKHICLNGLLALIFMLYGILGYFSILAFGMYYINLKVYITHEWKFETVLNVLFIAIVISFVLAITAAIKGIIKTLKKPHEKDSSKV